VVPRLRTRKNATKPSGCQANVLGVGPYIPIVFLALLIGLYGVYQIGDV